MMSADEKEKIVDAVRVSRDPREYRAYLRWLMLTENATVLRDGLPIFDMICTNRATGEIVEWLSTGEVRMVERKK